MTGAPPLLPSPSHRQTRMLPLPSCLTGLLASAALLLGTTASAQTLNFEVTAEITHSTCDVSAGDVDRDITLPEVNVSAFPTAGTVAGHRDFTLTLNNCDATLSQVGLNFTGSADADSNLRFANTGTAAGFALQLTSRGDDRIIGLDGLSGSRTLPVTAGGASLDLRASYWRSPRPTSGGTLVAQVLFEISYP